MSQEPKRERDPGEEVATQIRLIRAGIRNRDPETGRAGYERLKQLMGERFALNVVLVEQEHREQEQEKGSP